MQVCETFLNKKWQTVMWQCECEQSIHVQQPRGLDLGGKVLAKAKTFLSRPRPRIFTSRIFLRCPRGSSRPRPGLEVKVNKTAKGVGTGSC